MMRFMTMLAATFVAAAFPLGGGAWLATAGPPSGFPNLDGFSPVNVGDYVVDMGPRSNNVISFSSGDGKYGCDFIYEATAPGQTSGLRCEGQIPATPPGIPIGNTPPGASSRTWVAPHTTGPTVSLPATTRDATTTALSAGTLRAESLVWHTCGTKVRCRESTPLPTEVRR